MLIGKTAHYNVHDELFASGKCAMMEEKTSLFLKILQ